MTLREEALGNYIKELERRIAELEDKLSGKSAEVQSKLVEQEVRIAELERKEKAVEDAVDEMEKTSMAGRSLDFSNGFAKALIILRRHLSQLTQEPKENEG